MVGCATNDWVIDWVNEEADEKIHMPKVFVQNHSWGWGTDHIMFEVASGPLIITVVIITVVPNIQKVFFSLSRSLFLNVCINVWISLLSH